MRLRLTALAACLLPALALVPAHAAVPKVDGKKVQRLVWSQKTTTQQHVKDFYYGVDANKCRPPACNRYSFVWNPAKGVKGNVLFATKWTLPGQDYDLYVLNHRGAGVAGCGGYGGTGEAVEIPSSKLIPGETYTVITTFFVAVPDTMKNIVEFPTAHKAPASTPLGLVGGDCVLDGSTR